MDAGSMEDALSRLTPPARNRYFYGKLLDAYHFELEQNYFNRKRWLLNRLEWGWGTVCGLNVIALSDGTIVVEPGVAIDGLGREIIVPTASRALDPRQPIDVYGNPAGDRIANEDVVQICLAYLECETEPAPVLAGDCDTVNACAPSLVCERYRLQVVRKGKTAEAPTKCDLPADMFQQQNNALPNYRHDLIDCITTPCFTPTGPTCLVLAEIALEDGGKTVTDEQISSDMRPVVVNNPLLAEMIVCLAAEMPAPVSASQLLNPKLTHVTAISWTHDGTLDIATFLKGLTVTFSDTITATTNTGRAWFLVDVEYSTNAEAITTVRVLDQKISATGVTAEFTPTQPIAKVITQMLAEGVPVLCRIRILCDFLLDSQKRAVDGDFVGAVLPPTGDGVPGGLFESWFTFTNPPSSAGSPTESTTGGTGKPGKTIPPATIPEAAATTSNTKNAPAAASAIDPPGGAVGQSAGAASQPVSNTAPAPGPAATTGDASPATDSPAASPQQVESAVAQVKNGAP